MLDGIYTIGFGVSELGHIATNLSNHFDSISSLKKLNINFSNCWHSTDGQLASDGFKPDRILNFKESAFLYRDTPLYASGVLTFEPLDPPFNHDFITAIIHAIMPDEKIGLYTRTPVIIAMLEIQWIQ